MRLAYEAKFQNQLKLQGIVRQGPPFKTGGLYR